MKLELTGIIYSFFQLLENSCEELITKYPSKTSGRYELTAASIKYTVSTQFSNTEPVLKRSYFFLILHIKRLTCVTYFTWMLSLSSVGQFAPDLISLNTHYRFNLKFSKSLQTFGLYCSKSPIFP